jgi:SAM-dependent methyltransferase
MNKAYDPHGAALLDCFRGEKTATLVCYQDGARDDVPAAFWLREEIDPLEALALDLCRGRVLDVGAGAGVHSLALQRRGLAVTAIDCSADCVAIMHERGILDARQSDLFGFDQGPYDTVLCLCNGLDKVGQLSDLPRFLDKMRKLLVPGGQLIADSFDLRVGADADRLSRFEQMTLAGRYYGEMDLRFEYKSVSGEPFSVLHVDFETFARVADENGWAAEIVKAEGPHYLLRAQPR